MHKGLSETFCMFYWRSCSFLVELLLLGNLPVERAKDTVCFLQRCGVSLASSAIIYNIVK